MAKLEENPKSDAQQIQDLEKQIKELSKTRDLLTKQLHEQELITADVRKDRETTVGQCMERERILQVRLNTLRRMLEAAQLLADDSGRTINDFFVMQGARR